MTSCDQWRDELPYDELPYDVTDVIHPSRVAFLGLGCYAVAIGLSLKPLDWFYSFSAYNVLHVHSFPGSNKVNFTYHENILSLWFRLGSLSWFRILIVMKWFTWKGKVYKSTPQIRPLEISYKGLMHGLFFCFRLWVVNLKRNKSFTSVLFGVNSTKQISVFTLFTSGNTARTRLEELCTNHS